VAVLGCGAIAHQHLAVLSRLPGVEIAGVCDTSRAAARVAAERYGAAAAYTDSAEMLAVARPDVVHVLTPPQTHSRLVVDCLKSGAHVVCEKPMTGSAAETRDLLDAADQAGRILIESRNYLYNDPIRRLDAIIAEGRLGEVRDVEVLIALDLPKSNFGDLNLSGPGVALPGGAVQDLLPHMAYLFLHYAGATRVDDLSGILTNRSGNVRVGYDTFDALLEAGDVRGRLTVSSEIKPDCFFVRVAGTKGRAEVDLFQPYMRVQGGANVGKRAPIEQVLSGASLVAAGFRNLRDKVMQHSPYHGLGVMLDKFYEALRRGDAPPITRQEILDTALLVDSLVALREPVRPGVKLVAVP
jgi:predicted dehydrogenase